MNLKKLAELVGAECESDFEITALNTLQKAKEDEITFLENPRFLSLLSGCKAGAILIKEEHLSALPSGVIPLTVKNPQLAMAIISKVFYDEQKNLPFGETQISEKAEIEERVYIGKGAIIGDSEIKSGAYIGKGCVIGDGCVIHPNVVLYDGVKLGNRVIVHAGSVIGSDGYSYAHTHEGKHIKIYHFGNVVIEDDVEIGANCTIDRSVFETTRIKNGTKIDNLVHIAHNCEVGEHSLLAGQVGLSGSTTLGRNVVMGGQSGTAGHLEIGDFAVIAARGGVTKNIVGGKTYAGFPLIDHREWLKLQGKIHKLLDESKPKS